MSQIGIITTGAGVVTTITQNFVPQFMLVGAIDINNPLRNITVTVGGKVVQQVAGVAVIGAIMKYMMESLLGVDVKVGLLWKLANSFIGNQTLQLQLTNDGATTPIVYGFSAGKSLPVPVQAGQETIQASTKIEFDNTIPDRAFTALFFEATNFAYAQVEYTDGHDEQLLIGELDALFATENQCDADGKLNAVTVIDNRFGNFKKVTLYSTSGGAFTVTKLKQI